MWSVIGIIIHIKHLVVNRRRFAMQKKLNVHKLSFVGVMAAMIFVATYFLRIEIMTPVGPTNLKTANILCLLAGMLFGGVYGGLAAGIGSMIFDLMDPKYASGALVTLVFFFLMAYVCGVISNSGKADGTDLKKNILGAICGALTYYVLYIGKSILTLVIAGSAFIPAVAACSVKMVTSGINMITAVVFSVLLAKPLALALKRAKILDKIKN